MIENIFKIYLVYNRCSSLLCNTQIDTFFSKFATTAPRISWFVDAITSWIVRFKFLMLPDLVLETFSYTYPQRKKSKEDWSGDLVGIIAGTNLAKKSFWKPHHLSSYGFPLANQIPRSVSFRLFSLGVCKREYFLNKTR